MSIATCLACGDDFKTKPCKVAAGFSLYCSDACRLDFNGYRRLVQAAMPGTIKQLSKKSGVTVEIVRANVKRMLRANTWHIAEVIDVGYSGVPGMPRFEPVIANGPALDPNAPRDTRSAVTRHTEKMILASMPARLQDIALATEMRDSTCARHIGNLRKRGLCFVSGWVRAVRGSHLEVFTAGEGVDVPCRLKRLTQAEKTERYLKKIKSDGRIEIKRAKGRADYWRKKATQRGDSMIGFLFGRRPAGAPAHPSEE